MKARIAATARPFRLGSAQRGARPHDHEERMNPESKLIARVREVFGRILHGREAWALSDQAVVSATNFLTNVMLARFMGLREFGVFALAWMSVLFVNSIQYSLVISPMMSVGPKQEKQARPSYYGAVVFQELVLVCLCFVTVYVGVRLVGSHIRHTDVGYLAVPLAVSAFAYQLQDFFRRYFFVILQSRRALLNDALSYLTQLPILLALHWLHRLNSVTALWAMAGTSLVGIVVGWFWFEPFSLHWSRIRSIALQHWKIARWLTPSAVLQWTSGNLFIVAAPVYYGAAAAGVLKASQNLMAATHIWFQGLDNVVPPEAARRLHEGGVRRMLAYVRSVLFKWGGLTLAFALVMGSAPGFWLRLVYGPEMAHYGYVLRLFALFYVLLYVGSPLRAGLLALEFTAPVFWSYLAMTAFSISLAIPMAKWLQLSGVMIGLLGTQVIFQGIVATALLVRSRRALENEGGSQDHHRPFPAIAK
jgi:O-antigen/teichoic acid export membrane protein